MEHDMGSSDGSACKVSMVWNWHTIDACFLSSSWHITNNGMFAATCIGVVLLVILVEFLRRLGKEYDALIIRQFNRQAVICAAKDSAEPGAQIVAFRATVLQQAIRGLIHAATFGGAYITMLLAMYFNGFIIICILIGAGLGKFLCDWLVVKVDVEGLRSSGNGLKGVEETTVCCG